jgi:hypothetical protein
MRSELEQQHGLWELRRLLPSQHGASIIRMRPGSRCTSWQRLRSMRQHRSAHEPKWHLLPLGTRTAAWRSPTSSGAADCSRAEAEGMSLRQIAAELTARHVATPQGTAWSATSVCRARTRFILRSVPRDYRALGRNQGGLYGASGTKAAGGLGAAAHCSTSISQMRRAFRTPGRQRPCRGRRGSGRCPAPSERRPLSRPVAP